MNNLTEDHFFPRKWRVDNTHQNWSKLFKSKRRELHNSALYVIINSLNITNVLDFMTEFTLHCGQQSWQIILNRKQYHHHSLFENYFLSTIICWFAFSFSAITNLHNYKCSCLLDSCAQLQNNLLGVTHAYQRHTEFMQKLMAVNGSCYISLYNTCQHCCHSTWIASSFVDQNKALMQCKDDFCCSDNKVLAEMQY